MSAVEREARNESKREAYVASQKELGRFWGELLAVVRIAEMRRCGLLANPAEHQTEGEISQETSLVSLESGPTVSGSSGQGRMQASGISHRDQNERALGRNYSARGRGYREKHQKGGETIRRLFAKIGLSSSIEDTIDLVSV